MSDTNPTNGSNGASKKLTGAARADSWFHADGWSSALTGYGVPGKDKRQSAFVTFDAITDVEAADMWRSDDIAARIIEVIPNECLRQGFKLNCGDKEMSEDFHALSEELNVLAMYMLGKKYERAYGGSAIFPIINDQQEDLSQPLNWKRIPEVKHLTLFEPRELQPYSYYDDPLKPSFGEPKTFTVNPVSRGGATAMSGYEIHESRLIIFPGIRVSRAHQSTSHGWGDSVLCRVYQIVRDYGISWAAAAALLHEFSQASFKIKGLAQLLASDKDEVIKTRIRAVELSRSVINAVMMDSEEEFERKTTNIAGMPDLLDRFATRVAAAADMPVTLLMGQSPAGLNATGESDIRFFYDRVKVVQKLGIQPQLEKLMLMLMRSHGGPTKGKEPDNWSVEFNPLWQPTESEVATTRKVVADTDAVLISSGIASAEQIARARYGGDTYSMEFALDEKELKALEPDKEAGELDAEAAALNGEAPVAAGAAPADAGNVAASAMNGAQVSSLMSVVEKVGTKAISRESGIGILKVAFRLSESEANAILGPENFEPTKPEPKPSPFGAKEGKPNGVPEKKDEEEDDEEEDPDPDATETQPLKKPRGDGGPGSGNPLGNPGPRGPKIDKGVLKLKKVEAGAKNAFRTRNLQKETGQTPANIRKLLAKAGVPGPTEGKVWWFHKDDKETIVAIIKNGGKLPEGAQSVTIGQSDDEKVGSTKQEISKAVDKLPSGGKWSDEDKDDLKSIVEGKSGPLKSTSPSSVPPPPPSISKQELIASVPKFEPDAFAAVVKYTGNSYAGINNYLRKGPPPNASKTVKDMDKAFAKVAEKGGLPGGVIVNRSMSYEGLKAAGINLSEGATITDGGFMSTSIGPRPGSVEVELHVPKGTNAIYVEKFSNYQNEQELLLDRGTTIRINSMKVVQEKYGGKKTVIKAEVVSQKKTPIGKVDADAL